MLKYLKTPYKEFIVKERVAVEILESWFELLVSIPLRTKTHWQHILEIFAHYLIQWEAHRLLRRSAFNNPKEQITETLHRV